MTVITGYIFEIRVVLTQISFFFNTYPLDLQCQYDKLTRSLDLVNDEIATLQNKRQSLLKKQKEVLSFEFLIRDNCFLINLNEFYVLSN